MNRSRSIPPESSGNSWQGRPTPVLRPAGPAPAPDEGERPGRVLRGLLRKISDTPLILWHYVSNPRRIGAVAPSSGWLARAMARWVEIPPKGWVIELGAGTGAVTEALLARGVPPQQLVAIETVPRLVEVLRRRFPEVRLLQGDARKLTELIHGALGPNAPVAAVVSSLPLRAFTPEDRARVVQGIRALLPPGGRWIQFRYRLRHEPALQWEGFHLRQSVVVWRNIPPARVVLYERAGENAHARPRS